MNKKVLPKLLRVRLIVLIAVSSLLFVGCATSPLSPYKVITRHDKFDRYTTNSMTGNLLGGELRLELNAARHSAKDGAVNYALVVRYYGSNFIFIKPGESLILLIDGQRIGLKGQGSMRHRRTLENGMASELAKYPATPELLKKIANANQVDVKIKGSDFLAENYFIKQNFDNFKKFVNAYVK